MSGDPLNKHILISCIKKKIYFAERCFKIEIVLLKATFDENAATKPYLLKAINLKELMVEVEYTDKEGNKQLHIMPYQAR